MEFKTPNRYLEKRPKLHTRRARKTVTAPALAIASPQLALRSSVLSAEDRPSLARAEPKVRSWHYPSLPKRVVVPVCVAVVLAGGFYAVQAFIQYNHLSINANGIGVSESADVKPDFNTVLPHNTSIGELGGWQRISPPGNEPVYAFADTIDSVPVSVSEQPLPKSFQSDVDDQIAELAKKFNATTKIDNEGVKVYVGTSAKGPQSAILTKNNLLILIKSQRKIGNDAWGAYAKSLR